MIKTATQTKKDKTLAFLLTKKPLTSLAAITYVGTTRLAPIIHDLRQEGYNIKTDMKQDLNGCMYASYRLVGNYA